MQCTFFGNTPFLLKITITLLFSSLSLSTAYSTEKEVFSIEKNSVSKTEVLEFALEQVDKRPWKLGFESQEDVMLIKEFILKNEDIENWSEIISFHYVFQSKLSCEQYYHNFMNALYSSNPQNSIKVKILKNSPQFYFWEWRIDANTPEDEHEWVSIAKHGETFIIYRYTTKNLDEEPSKLKKWKQFIGDTVHTGLFAYHTPLYGMKIPLHWQICEIKPKDNHEPTQFIASCDFTATISTKCLPTTEAGVDDIKTMRNFFNISTPQEGKEDIRFNNGEIATLYTFAEDSSKGTYPRKKIIAKLQKDDKTIFLLITLVVDENFSYKRQECLHILQTFELIPQ